MAITSFKSSIEGPRWAGIESFLKTGAWNRGLKIEVDIVKGLVRHTYLFEVTGEERSVNDFVNTIRDIIQEWNEG